MQRHDYSRDSGSGAPLFYLASTDTAGFDIPRKCWYVRQLRTKARDDLLLVRIEPKVRYKGTLRDKVVLAARAVGDSVVDVRIWPTPVYVALIEESLVTTNGFVDSTNLNVIAWAEVYPSEADAERSLMGDEQI